MSVVPPLYYIVLFQSHFASATAAFSCFFASFSLPLSIKLLYVLKPHIQVKWLQLLRYCLPLLPFCLFYCQSCGLFFFGNHSRFFSSWWLISLFFFDNTYKLSSFSCFPQLLLLFLFFCCQPTRLSFIGDKLK